MKRSIMLLALALSMNACATKPHPIKIDVVPTTTPLVENVATPKPIVSVVYFAFDKSLLTDSGKRILDMIKKSYEYKMVRVTGYCDELGSIEYNDILGLKRAQAVADYLRDVDGIMIEVFSKGKSEARHTNDDNERSKDRKVILER